MLKNRVLHKVLHFPYSTIKSDYRYHLLSINPFLHTLSGKLHLYFELRYQKAPYIEFYQYAILLKQKKQLYLVINYSILLINRFFFKSKNNIFKINLFSSSI